MFGLLLSSLFSRNVDDKRIGAAFRRLVVESGEGAREALLFMIETGLANDPKEARRRGGATLTLTALLLIRGESATRCTRGDANDELFGPELAPAD